MKHIKKQEKNFKFELEIDDNFFGGKLSECRDFFLDTRINDFTEELVLLDKISRKWNRGAERKPIQTPCDKGEAIYSDSSLIISDQQIMQAWEQPLMKDMAEIVTESHGDILEIGFGMGISASHILEAGVKSYTVIECNEGVKKEFEKWRRKYPDTKTEMIFGRWEDVIGSLGLYDGIFYDTYESTEEDIEYASQQSTIGHRFFKSASEHLKKGGIFTYLSCEFDSLSRSSQRALLQYFKEISIKITDSLEPPEDCNYWEAPSIVTVRAVK